MRPSWNPGLLTPGVLCPFRLVNEFSTAVAIHGAVVCGRGGRGEWLAFILLPNTVKVKCILGGINQEGMSSMPSQGTTRKSAVLHFSGL